MALEPISADGHDWQQALYEPLTQALRNPIEASTRTGVDAETIRDAG